MVLGICRRALRNPDDVADAFQATFLILVRKAATVRVEDSLGRWLYGVSRRVSARARRTAARRPEREFREIELAAAPASDVDELRDVLDEEIGRLPEKFRSAVVLCDLEGFGHDEAARQLGCAVGTVKSRLSRAREKLRSRLIRRGVAPTAWAMFAESASAAVPAELMKTTLKAATTYAGGVVSPAVTLLIQGVLRAMLLKKFSTIAITVVASLAVATSAGVLARQAGTLPAQDQPDGQRAEKKVGVEYESASNASSTFTSLTALDEPEEEPIDLLESLRLDVELLETEINTRKEDLNLTNNHLIQLQLNGTNSAGEVLPLDVKQSQIEDSQKKLREIRKVYISKKKELAQKLAQLTRIETTLREEEKQRRLVRTKPKQSAGIALREAGTDKPPLLAPPASDTSGISPILEKRLSAIEGKLDNVLNALEVLKQTRRTGTRP
jgi:RNA polymerase sigma-70 factor (ECF subfamily)